MVLILELVPNGVVLRFANPEGEPWIRTYNYFSLTPFGYANFGPLLTALLSCILLLLVMVNWFRSRQGLNTALAILSAVATATNFFPLLYGFQYVTPIGVIIGFLLAGICLVCLIKEK